jgi:hypothetical protein
VEGGIYTAVSGRWDIYSGEWKVGYIQQWDMEVARRFKTALYIYTLVLKMEAHLLGFYLFIS